VVSGCLLACTIVPAIAAAGAGDVERCEAKFGIGLILEGIATIEDGKREVELGVDRVYVSNHGRCQLDHGLGPIEVLPEIVAAVGGRARVIIDGGIAAMAG